LDQAVEAFATKDIEGYGGHHHATFFHDYYSGRFMLLGDGSVRFASFGTDRTVTSQLMTIIDGKPDSTWDENMSGESLDILRWDNVIRFWACVIITLFPLPWVWINPSGKQEKRLVETKSDP
jgi:hypothetical protein